MSTSAQKAKIGFVGCGNFCTNSLMSNLYRVHEADLVAVCDLHEGRREAAARNFGARRSYDDMEAMLDKEELDGVFVVGPAPQQYKLAPAVITRGIPVYVEKPSANLSSEARELAELAEAHNTWGQCGFMKRFADVYSMAKEISNRPEFGPTTMVKARFGQGPYPQIWGIDSPKRSMLIGQLVHVFDLVRYFGGDVASVHAFYHEHSETQFAYVANLRFKSGALGQLDLNGLENKAGFRDISEVLQVVGVENHIICEDMLTMRWGAAEDFTDAAPHAGRYYQSFKPGWNGINPNRRTYGYEGEVRHFAQRCLGQVEDGPDLWDSYHALQIGEAIYDSAHEGRVVELP